MKKKILSSLLCIIAASSAVAFAGIRPPSYLDIDTGYRWDKMNFSGTNGFGVVQVNHVNSYQLGLKGLWNICESPWYFKGEGHYGWVCSGNYIVPGIVHGHGMDGHTWDGSLSTGYLFCMHPCWGLAPVVGWSNTQFNLNSKNTEELGSYSFVPANLGTQKISATVNGPWGGIDVFILPYDCFFLTLDYELHFAHWHERNDYFTSTFTTHHRRFWGNAFQIDGTYCFCQCLEAGLSLKYQIWKKNGSGVGHITGTTVALQSLEWDSFSLMFHLGYAF